MEATNPKKAKKWLKITGITLAVLVVVAGLGAGSYFLFFNQNVAPAADFTVTTVDDVYFSLSDNRGKVVLIDFMYIDCDPCQQLIPHLVDIRSEFDASLVMLTIDVFPSQDNKTELLNFANSYNASWYFALDTQGITEKYGVTTLPKTVVIDQEGYVTFAKSGFNTEVGLEEAIRNTLEGKAERISVGYTYYLVIALLAGILSFFTPCAFPLLPSYMAFNLDLLSKEEIKFKEKLEKKKEEEEEETEIETETKKQAKSLFRNRLWKSFLWGGSAALGVVVFYMIIGTIAALVGEAIGPWVHYITPVIGVLLVILGIISLTPFTLDMGFAINAIDKILGRNNLLEDIDEDDTSKKAQRKRKLNERKIVRKKRQDARWHVDENDTSKKAERKRQRYEKMKEREAGPRQIPQTVQLFFYGVTYALASVACNGPILLGMVLNAIDSGAFGKAILIFVVYSVAMAFLMIVITMLVGLSKDVLLDKLRASTTVVKIISGILLILAGGFLVGYFLWNFYQM
ncbi:MAG: redoxin domain-containing protein [Candidatus Heimdallarchaeota archaeon]